MSMTSNDVGGTGRNDKQGGHASSMCLNIVLTNPTHLLRGIHKMSEKNTIQIDR